MTVESIFGTLIDFLNAGRWADLALCVRHGQVIYNRRPYAHDEFMSRMEERIGALPDGAFELDTVVADEERQVVGARIVYRTILPEEEWEVRSDQEPREKAEKELKSNTTLTGSGGGQRRLTGVHHLFCWFDDGKASKIETIGDVDGVFKDETVLSNTQASAAGTASTTPVSVLTSASTSAPPTSTRLSATDLMQTYHAYVKCINDRTMVADLPRFCHRTVLHNGRQLTLSEYQSLMSDAQDTISGLTFTVRTLIADETQQRLAVQLAFEGIPIKKWAGVEPGGGEGRVHFSEHVFYWFSEGRIYKVLSLVDVASYRKQVRESSMLKDRASAVAG